jgi:hypothetical protein
MQEYMALFGSGINSYGGPGESVHKQFIIMPVVPGRRTQQRAVSLHSRLHFNTTTC